MGLEDKKSFFNERNYVVVKNFFSKEVADLLYPYCLTKVKSVGFKKVHCFAKYDKDWDGGIEPEGEQVPTAFGNYADVLMETLLEQNTAAMEGYTGLSLVPNYTYWRLYRLGNELERHTDRESCEISVTVCLGYDASNVGQDYNWPMYVFDKVLDKEVPVYMEPGDAVIYKGCEIEHWRDNFQGINQAQAFFHYNDSSREGHVSKDGRAMLAVPQFYEIERYNPMFAEQRFNRQFGASQVKGGKS